MKYQVRFFCTERQRLIGIDSPKDDESRDFDNRFQVILYNHLTVFASWSILNSVVGLISLIILKGNAYYFSMMSCIWGIINLGFAVAFFYHTLYRKQPKSSLFERLKVQSHVEQMMLLNCGLDVAYVLVGFGLREHSFISDVSYPDLWLGFGWAIILQGLYLLVQDAVFLRLYRGNLRIHLF